MSDKDMKMMKDFIKARKKGQSGIDCLPDYDKVKIILLDFKAREKKLMKLEKIFKKRIKQAL
ncbi:MAG: hypothetical protein OXJ52_03730 [Oligoflexia bacterium]|nr:hypothetical protein [Oligoflexia bacterium]